MESLSKTASFAITWITPLVVLLLVLYFRNRNRKYKYPPGPGWALPVVGNLYQLGAKPHLTFQKWKKQYGPLFSFTMASQPTIVVNDPKLMKELLSTGASAGRPRNAFYDDFSSQGHGIMFSDGRNWEEQRGFAVKTLRELGLSKSGRLEGIILDEAKTLVAHFEQKVGVPFAANRIFNGAVVTTLWGIMTGEKAEWEVDGKIVESGITKLSGELMLTMNQAVKTGLVAIPWLRHFPRGSAIWNRYVATFKSFHRMVDATVEKHKETLDTLSPRDLIDHSLIRMKATKDPSSSFYKETGNTNLQGVIGDLFFAGSETTATGLVYSLLYLGSHLKIQTKLHKELDSVLGSSSPSLSDRASLPYTVAVLMEILRRSAIGAASIHRIMEDVEFHGYLLPKNALLYIDYFSVLRDEHLWGQSVDDFKPERFLNQEETEVVKHPAYIPFSVGRRMCIGESLAWDTMFLFVTSIFQTFRVEVVTQGTEGTIDFDDVESGFTLEPPEFDICVHLRK